MQVRLIIVGGTNKKGQVSLTLPTVIGRSREADLTVAHPMISRKHCELAEADGLVTIRDLDSLNGTLVGGEKISDTVTLRPDTEVTIGPVIFRVDYEYAEAGDDAVTIGPGGAATQEFSSDEPDFQGLLDESPAAASDAEMPDFTEWAAADEGEEEYAPPPGDEPDPAPDEEKPTQTVESLNDEPPKKEPKQEESPPEKTTEQSVADDETTSDLFDAIDADEDDDLADFFKDLEED